MDSPNPRIIEELQMFAKRGVKFEAAKEALKSSGWGDEEILQATEQFPYELMAIGVDDGDYSNPVNLRAAEAIGAAAINDQRIDARNQATLDGLASEFAPDIESRAVYESKFMDDLGIPWYIWLPLPILVIIGVVAFHLPEWVLTVLGIFFGCYVMYVFYQRFRRRP